MSGSSLLCLIHLRALLEIYLCENRCDEKEKTHKDMATAMGMVDKTHALAYQNAIFLTKEFDMTVT